ncbi:MAG: DUF2892 domain-containing protein [Gammaproteobacteria bacterium]|nr:DUF2892 domain-containing protein [Gammaproteobacteria bacterium]MCF6361898.1 DUF2892 domain-containing protein [Gammaproteobacteria bacterium]
MANVGGADRAVRVIVGAVVVGATAVGPWSEVLSPWGYIGVVPLLSGLIGVCPAYSLIGLSTKKHGDNAP